MNWMKTQKAIKWSTIISTALIIVCTALLSWLYATNSGLKWLVSQVNQADIAGLSIGKVEGSLMSGLNLAELKWQQAEHSVQAKNINIACQWLDLIDRQLTCQLIELASVQYTTQATSTNTNTSLETIFENLPPLPELDLAFTINIKKILVNQVVIREKKAQPAQQLNPQQDSSYQALAKVNQVILTKLALKNNKVSVAELKLNYLNHHIKAAGFVQATKKWRHQLELTITGPQLSLTGTSKGTIKAQAKFTAAVSAPYQINLSNNWHWQQGLYLSNGLITAPKQDVMFEQTLYQLDKTNITYQLTWPSLFVNAELTANSALFNQLQLQMKTEVEKIYHWRAASTLELLLTTQLDIAEVNQWAQAKTAGQVPPTKQAKPHKLPEKTNIYWPAVAQINIDLVNDKLNVSSNNLKVGDLSGKVNGNIQLAEQLTDFPAMLAHDVKLQASIQGQLSQGISSLDDINVKGLTSELTITKNHNTDQQWQIKSQGQVEQLKLLNIAQLNTNKLAWHIDFSKIWQSNIKADNVTFTHSAQTANLSSPSLTISGSSQKHEISLVATTSNLLNLAEEKENKAHLQVTGELANFDNLINGLASYSSSLTNQENNKNTGKSFEQTLDKVSWQLTKLNAQLPLKGQVYKITANNLYLNTIEQQANALCISTESTHQQNQQNGNFCANGHHKQGNWQTELLFNQWAVSPVLAQAKSWLNQESLPDDMQAVFNGKIDLAGSGQQITKIDGDLTSANFMVKLKETEFRVKDLVLSSQLDNKTQGSSNAITQTTLAWQSIDGELVMPDWRTFLNIPKGKLTIAMNNTFSNDDFVMELALEQPNIRWTLPHSNIQQVQTHEKKNVDITEPVTLTVEHLSLTSSLVKNRINNRLTMQLPEDDVIKAEFTSDWPMLATAKINGAIFLSLQQFDWLKQWQSQIDKIDLTLQQNFVVSGLLKQPLIDGQGELAIKHFVMEEIGIDIRDSKINLTSAQDKINLAGELNNLQGQLAVAGNVKISSPIQANLAIDGHQVTLINSKDNNVIASPKLTANYQNDHLNVNGKIVIDQANIKITSLPKQAVSVSEDQQIIGESQVESSALSYNIDLTVEAGEKVKISGFGVQSDIQGKLNSSLQSGEPVKVNGRLDLKNGKFEAYKQVLTIEQGQLLFLGSAENPGIQFKAVRTIDEVKVGIIADGTVNAPRLMLYSEPTMADENILSLLITGRNINSLSKNEGSALSSAAIGLGVEGANKLAQKIGATLGINNLEVTSKSINDGTRIDLAAKVNDRLNVGYGTIIDSENQVQAGWIIEYKLSPNISFEAISGDEISANINYKKQFSATKENKEDRSQK